MPKRRRKSGSHYITTDQLREWAESGELTGRIGLASILAGSIQVNQLTELCEELCAESREARRLHRPLFV